MNTKKSIILTIIVSFVLVACIVSLLVYLNKLNDSKTTAKAEDDKVTEETEKGKKEKVEKVVYDRQDRIDAYQAAHPELNEKECIKRVYMNLDCDPYTNTTQVSDLDSYTMLVNKYNGLPSDYVPSDLTVIPGGVEIRAQAADAFNQLAQGCSNIGLTLTGWSAFRSYDYQNSLYTNGVNNYGLEYAESYWTHPGYSEHQTGLTIDVCLDGDQSDLDAARYNAHYSEFVSMLHEYGFILRYPDDKQEYTQIAPESWHIRYVGVELATYLYEHDLCLDEYYGLKDAGLLDE